MTVAPNFFIIGAPKCGTSSLFGWLSSHPAIGPSARKETFVLMDRDHPLARSPGYNDQGLRAYDTHFEPAAANAPIRMEATTHYLYQTTALEVLAGMPDARVAVVLRDPAQRVYSSYSYTRNNLGRLDPALDFAGYLDLVRRRQPLYPRWCRHEGSAYVLQRDPDYSRYANFLRNWQDRLGRDRVYPLLFEDLRADPAALLTDLCRWLGLDPALLGRQDFAARNRTTAVRHHRLQRAAREVNRRVPMPAGLKTGLKTLLSRVQRPRASTITAADRDAVATLAADYADSNRQLADLTGLDLSAWDCPRTAQPEAAR